MSDNINNNLEITVADTLGRHFVTKDDIKKGERLFTEQALVIGPHVISGPVCLNCWALLPPAPFAHGCNRCHIAPLCSTCIEGTPSNESPDRRNVIHTLKECDAFISSKLDYSLLIRNLQVVMPFRCLTLSEQDINHILGMEAHIEKRRDTQIWILHTNITVKALYDFGLIDPEKWNEETILRLCSVLDVNTFEVRSPAGNVSTARALYPRAALMSHDCVPNTHVTIDKNFAIRAFASRDITNGTPIYCSYTNIMHPTWKRREHLREGKYFECMCDRCKDNTELGTHLQSLVCAGCSIGQVIPVNPLSSDPWSADNVWSCLSCNKSYQAPSVKAMLDIYETRIAITDKTNVEALENLLKCMEPVFTPHHHLMLEVKETLVICLRDKHVPAQNLPVELLRRKADLCKELVDVLKILSPGVSRLTGIAHYEYYVAYAQLSNVELNSQLISAEQYFEQLKYAEDLLRAAINLLIYEPDNSPEGQLVKSAFHDLHLMKSALFTNDDEFVPRVPIPRFSTFGRF